jgi:undecaprenyl-diphosphatase
MVKLPRPAEEQISAFDDRVDKWFDGHLAGRSWADRLFYSASSLGDHGTIWLILAAVRGLRSDEGYEVAIRAAAAVGLESVLINGPVKWMFRRERPVRPTDHPRPFRTPRTSSFPSGHATSAFCAAALLADGDPRWAPVYYALAVIVSASRVYVKTHHASDVVGGAIIGAALGEVSRRIAPLPRPTD